VIEILHRKVEIEKEEYRKKSLFSPSPADDEAILTLSPKSEDNVISVAEDFGLKC